MKYRTIKVLLSEKNVMALRKNAGKKCRYFYIRFQEEPKKNTLKISLR